MFETTRNPFRALAHKKHVGCLLDHVRKVRAEMESMPEDFGPSHVAPMVEMEQLAGQIQSAHGQKARLLFAYWSLKFVAFLVSAFEIQTWMIDGKTSTLVAGVLTALVSVSSVFIPDAMTSLGRRVARVKRRYPFLSNRPAAALEGAQDLFDSVEAILPHRFLREEFGDALEFISRMAAKGAPAWKIRAKAITTVVIVLWNVTRQSVPVLREVLALLAWLRSRLS